MTLAYDGMCIKCMYYITVNTFRAEKLIEDFSKVITDTRG